MIAKRKPVAPLNDGRPFVEYAWREFDALHVLKILLSGNFRFLGQNQILFAALSAWVVAPKDDKLRHAAIVRAVRQKLVSFETPGRSNVSPCLSIADVCKRLMRPRVAPFYDEIYYPIGSLKTLTGPFSRPDFLQFYRNNANKVNTALEIAEVYHYHSAHLFLKENYRPASLNATAPLIKMLGGPTKREGGDAVDNIKKQWRASRPSISLAYAASSLRFKSGARYKDLLHVMQSGERALKVPSDVLPKLIGRARFFEESVLSQTYLNEGDGVVLSKFGIEAIAMKCRQFSEDERAKVTRAFVRYPKVG